MSDAATASETGQRTSGGLVRSFPDSFRASDSLLFRSYAVVAGLVGLLISLLLAAALIVWFVSTLGSSALVTSSNALLGVVAVFVLGPLFAPVLLVARRHRRGRPDARYDRRLALAGYLFVASLYVGLVITVPPAQQEAISGVLAPVVEFLYGLPAVVGVVPPALAATLLWLVHRRSR
jgi:hypothetical protein